MHPNQPSTIRDLPHDLRPTERLQYAGPSALNTAELLAIILRSGGPGENAIHLAQRILSQYDGLVGLANAPLAELCQLHNIGPGKATQIQAAIELGKRLYTSRPADKIRITHPHDIAALCMLEMQHLPQEELRVVALDTRNQILKTTTLYKGSVHSAVIRVAEIFRDPIRLNASAIILVHNHPSGDASPSPEDVRTTRQIYEAGELLCIDLLDHIIIGNGFVSMKERGLCCL